MEIYVQQYEHQLCQRFWCEKHQTLHYLLGSGSACKTLSQSTDRIS